MPGDSVSNVNIPAASTVAPEPALQPTTRPDCYPESILWNQSDYTSQNSNPKSFSAIEIIRHLDGTPFSAAELTSIHTTVQDQCEDLWAVGRVKIPFNSDLPSAKESRKWKWMKTNLRSEIKNAILELEKIHPVVGLCSDHWKARALLTNHLSRSDPVLTAIKQEPLDLEMTSLVHEVPVKCLPEKKRARSVISSSASQNAEHPSKVAKVF
jgi:hypothetical protein